MAGSGEQAMSHGKCNCNFDTVRSGKLADALSLAAWVEQMDKVIKFC